jgi:ankyrin repeat protein
MMFQSLFNALKRQKYNKEMDRAMFDNDIDRLKSLIGASTSETFHPNAKSDNGLTLLHTAVVLGNLEMTKLLIESGCKPSERTRSGETTLGLAAEKANVPMLELLISHGVDVNEFNKKEMTALATASRLRDDMHADERQIIQACKVLLDNGADPNLVGSSNKSSPLLGAIERGHIGVCDLLLKSQANPNAVVEGWTPLSFAGAYGTEAISTLLMTHGAALDPQNDNNKGIAHPLMAAANSGNFAVCKMHLDSGMDPNMRDHEGQSPLHKSATSMGFLETTRLLVEGGANINSQCAKGQTPLHIAMSNLDQLTTQYLLSQGADLNLHNKQGKTPLVEMLSVNANSITLCTPLHLLMIAHGAKPESDEFNLTARQAAIKGGFVERLQVLLSTQPSNDPRDSLTALMESPDSLFSKKSAEIMSVLQSHAAREAMDLTMEKSVSAKRFSSLLVTPNDGEKKVKNTASP